MVDLRYFIVVDDWVMLNFDVMVIEYCVYLIIKGNFKYMYGGVFESGFCVIVVWVFMVLGNMIVVSIVYKVMQGLVKKGVLWWLNNFQFGEGVDFEFVIVLDEEYIGICSVMVKVLEIGRVKSCSVVFVIIFFDCSFCFWCWVEGVKVLDLCMVGLDRFEEFEVDLVDFGIGLVVGEFDFFGLDGLLFGVFLFMVEQWEFVVELEVMISQNLEEYFWMMVGVC